MSFPFRPPRLNGVHLSSGGEWISVLHPRPFLSTLRDERKGGQLLQTNKKNSPSDPPFERGATFPIGDGEG